MSRGLVHRLLGNLEIKGAYVANLLAITWLDLRRYSKCVDTVISAIKVMRYEHMITSYQKTI